MVGQPAGGESSTLVSLSARYLSHGLSLDGALGACSLLLGSAERSSERYRSLRKKIPKEQNLMDRMDTTELVANQFRMTQARDKLAHDRMRSPQQAIQTHEQVGRKVRAAIERIGSTLPENLKPAEHIGDVASA